ncbi:hypothetical protein U9Y75_23025 [Escherichia coli]
MSASARIDYNNIACISCNRLPNLHWLDIITAIQVPEEDSYNQFIEDATRAKEQRNGGINNKRIPNDNDKRDAHILWLMPEDKLVLQHIHYVCEKEYSIQAEKNKNLPPDKLFFDYQCWCGDSSNQIAAMTGISPKTVRQSLQFLATFGFIKEHDYYTSGVNSHHTKRRICTEGELLEKVNPIMTYPHTLRYDSGKRLNIGKKVYGVYVPCFFDCQNAYNIFIQENTQTNKAREKFSRDDFPMVNFLPEKATGAINLFEVKEGRPVSKARILDQPPEEEHTRGYPHGPTSSGGYASYEATSYESDGYDPDLSDEVPF